VAYLIQFVAGTQELVRASLAGALKGFRVIHADDSSLLFDATTQITTHAQVPFANNAFVVLASTPRRELGRSVRDLAAQANRATFPPVPRNQRGFRVMVHVDGKLTPVDRGGKVALERAISSRIRLPVEARGSGQEYWVIGRKNLKTLLLCARLPKPKRPDRQAGSLSPELAAMLVAAARIRKGETLLDPFGGSGALTEAAIESPAGALLYSDTDLKTYLPGMPRQLKTNRQVKLLDEDAVDLPSVSSRSVDVIVTDPPWGEFAGVGESYADFATRIAGSFDRVLDRDTGRFVVLIARRQSAIFAGALRQRGFAITETIGILVNGHPADVLIGGRQSGKTRQAGH